MKFFADLHLCPSIEKPDQTRELVRRSADLGYNAAGIVFPPSVKEEEIHETSKICDSLGVGLVSRVNLAPKNPASLLRSLAKLRRRFEVISVMCYSKTVARQAAKDRRVDLLSFPPTDMRKRFFDSAEAELASKALASLEIEMAPLLFVQGFQRSRLLTFLRRETLIAKKFNVPIVLSSGGNSPSHLRKPDNYAFLSYLFGLDFHEAKKAFSENPQAIIERNRRKLSSDYVAPGVHIVRRGEDCPEA